MTRAARRAAGAAALTLALALTAAACRGSSDDSGEPSAAPSATPTEPPVETLVTIGKVTGDLPAAARDKLATEITAVVDGWTEAAYVGGEYPRRDFADSWPGFTAGAADLARRDRALMSNEDIGEQIDGAVTRRSRVRLDVLAVKKQPVGVTARVLFTFETTGEVERAVRVQGRLYLSRTADGWQVFGYDMTKGAAL
jgi:hypothetical protein